MSKVLHLIPYDTVGGVETAVRSLPERWDGPAGMVQFCRGYLVTHSPVEVFPGDWHGAVQSVNHPAAHWKFLRFALRTRANLVIASLWRSCPTFIALKVLRPRTKTVLFLHSAVDVHVFDRVFNRIAMRLANEIWADSASTIEARVPPARRKDTKLISFLTCHPATSSDPMLTGQGARPSANFVYWGRLQSEKNLELALDVFNAIRQRLPEARFDIIGPDRGSLADLQDRVAALGLGQAVQFLGAMPQEDVLARARDYSFYLQTSRFEGMAMSVIEAMGAGLVPVVTPVGEIPRYCVDGQNGIHVTSPEETAKQVAAALDEPAHWQELSTRAAEKWVGARLFEDDYRDACNALLQNSRNGESQTCAG